MKIQTAEPFPYVSETLTHNIKPEFVGEAVIIAAMIDRVKARIRYLSHYGARIKGVNVTDAKDTAREIHGEISMISAVCECDTLIRELLTEMTEALNTALARLRK